MHQTRFSAPDNVGRLFRVKQIRSFSENLAEEGWDGLREACPLWNPLRQPVLSPPADGVRSEQWRKGRKGEWQSRCCTVVVNSYELVSQILTLMRPVTSLWYNWSGNHGLGPGIERTDQCDRSCVGMRGGWKIDRGHLEVLPRRIASWLTWYLGLWADTVLCCQGWGGALPDKPPRLLSTKQEQQQQQAPCSSLPNQGLPDFETPVWGFPLQHDGVAGSRRLWKPPAWHYREGGLWGACGEIWTGKEHCAGGWHNEDRLARRSHQEVSSFHSCSACSCTLKTAFDTHVRSPSFT